MHYAYIYNIMHYNEYIYNISHLNAKFKKLINNSRNTYFFSFI